MTRDELNVRSETNLTGLEHNSGTSEVPLHTIKTPAVNESSDALGLYSALDTDGTTRAARHLCAKPAPATVIHARFASQGVHNGHE